MFACDAVGRTSPASAWRRKSRSLAEWTMGNLVNRRDVWGSYLPVRRRAEKVRGDGTTFIDKTRTAPAKSRRGEVLLTEHRVALHYGGADGAIIGLHTTGPDNRCRWGAIEVDNHGGGEERARANLRAMLHWRDTLLALDFDPTLTDSDGNGGYHLRMFFEEPVPAPRLFLFLSELVSDHRAIGLTNAPELFPKQSSLPPGGYGNWLRLYGRHHTRDHWTRVFNGSDWAEGEEAVDLLLLARPDSPGQIPTPAAKPAIVPAAASRPRPLARRRPQRPRSGFAVPGRRPRRGRLRGVGPRRHGPARR